MEDGSPSTVTSVLLTAMDSDSPPFSSSPSSTTTTVMVVFSTLVAVCGSFVFGSAVGFSSPAETGIMDDLGLSLEEYSVFGSILTIGAMIGAVMSGKIADKLGRRMTMGLSEMFCLLGWLAVIYSKVSWLLDTGRLSIGYGIGVLSYVVPVYIAEITPQNLRGAFTTVNQLMICIGVSVMWLIGIVIPWRKLALIGTIPCLLQAIGLFFIPESPRWLAKIGLWKDCESALHRLRGENADISEEAAEIRDYTETLHHLSETRVFDLFQPEYAKSLIVGVGLMVLQQFGGVNAIAFYANSIFISAGYSSSIGSIAMVIIQVPSTLLGVLLMDVSGRRPLLMVSAAGTCLGCLLLGISFLIQDLQLNKGISPILALVGILVFSGSFSLGMGGIPWVIMSEIFPINIKGSAGSLVTVINWFGSWVVSYSFNFLMECSTEGFLQLVDYPSTEAQEWNATLDRVKSLILDLIDIKRNYTAELQAALSPLTRVTQPESQSGISMPLPTSTTIPPTATNNPTPPTATTTITPTRAPTFPLMSTFKAVPALPPTVPSKVGPKQAPPTAPCTTKTTPILAQAPMAIPTSSLIKNLLLRAFDSSRARSVNNDRHDSGFSHLQRVFLIMIWDPRIT